MNIEADKQDRWPNHFSLTKQINKMKYDLEDCKKDKHNIQRRQNKNIFNEQKAHKLVTKTLKAQKTATMAYLSDTKKDDTRINTKK